MDTTISLTSDIDTDNQGDDENGTELRELIKQKEYINNISHQDHFHHQQHHKRTGSKLSFHDLNDDLIIVIFSFFVRDDTILDPVMLVSKTWYELANRRELWQLAPTRLATKDALIQNHNLVLRSFRYFGLKIQGTEGKCFKVLHRASGQLYAMKKARVVPQAEGVPYYMLRELSFLQGIKHQNISTLQKVSLFRDNLYLFFDYVPSTLFDLINPENNPGGGIPLPQRVIKKILHQILEGVAYCHRRGVLHRNLKPKHILLAGLVDTGPFPTTKEQQVCHPSLNKIASTTAGSSSTMDGNKGKMYSDYLERAMACTVRIADFALVRAGTVPLRSYTTEVVTLWYRAPEILMGGKYFSAVDIWSVGCIFAEMTIGRPLFPGICEIDQLFQIFYNLGTPSESTWKGFKNLPNFTFQFPCWKKSNLKRTMGVMDPKAFDLLEKLLDLDPERRITAEAALRHPYFNDCEDNIRYQAISPFKAELDSLRPEYPQQRSIFFSSKNSISIENPIPIESHLKPPNTPEDLLSGRYSPISQSPTFSISNGNWFRTRRVYEMGMSAHSASLKRTQEEFWSHFGDWLPNPHKVPLKRQRPGLSDAAFISRYYANLKVVEKRTTPKYSFDVLLKISSTAIEERNQAKDSFSKPNGNARMDHDGASMVSIVTTNGTNNTTAATTTATTQPPQMTEQNRLSIITWLIDLIDRFEMSLRSVFLCLNYTYRYLEKYPEETPYMTRVAASALHVASKLEDVSYIGVEDLVTSSNRAFENDELLNIEEKLLTTLRFELTVPTALDFFGIFLERFLYTDADEDIVSAARTKQNQPPPTISPMNFKLMTPGASSILSSSTDDGDDNYFQLFEGYDKPTACLTDESRTALTNSQQQVSALGMFLCELSLQDPLLVSYPCSQVSAGVIVSYFYSCFCLSMFISHGTIFIGVVTCMPQYSLIK